MRITTYVATFVAGFYTAVALSRYLDYLNEKEAQKSEAWRRALLSKKGQHFIYGQDVS